MEITDYGICRLALVPVRKGPSHVSEQLTQLLFGEHYEVLAVGADKLWLHVRAAFDHLEGWIDAGHHHGIAKDYFDQINHADFKITTDTTASLLYKKSALTILMGSIVPISTSELFKMEEQLAFNGEAKSLGQKRDNEFVRSIAMKYINVPAVPGGRSPFGIDSIGLVQMVYRISGYALPHEHARMAAIGKNVGDVESARCGDIAFFESESNDLIHCGIVLEDARIIHACGRVRIDHINEEGILNTESRIYTHHLAAIRRIILE